jgi:hypothetical protein
MNRTFRTVRSSDQAWKFLTVIVTVCLALLTWGCSSTSQAKFNCDSHINDGLLLAIDLVEVTDEEVKQIQEAGDGWFTSPTRDQLRNRIKTISVPGGCSETVELASLTSSEKYLRKKKGYGTLAVIAEYQTITGDSTKPRMIFKPRTAWKGKTTLFRVHEDFLSVEGVR